MDGLGDGHPSYEGSMQVPGRVVRRGSPIPSRCETTSVLVYFSFGGGEDQAFVCFPSVAARCPNGSYLVDSASSHMLVSKIKPCMSKYKHSYCETANGSLNQLSFI